MCKIESVYSSQCADRITDTAASIKERTQRFTHPSLGARTISCALDGLARKAGPGSMSPEVRQQDVEQLEAEVFPLMGR